MKLVDGAVEFLKKNDSKLLLGASLILGGVTIVTTIKSTRKVDPILNEHKNKMTKIKMEFETGVKNDKETRKETFKTYAATTGEVLKLYRVPIAAGALSLGCNLASNKLLSDRNVGLQAAVAGVSQSFENYRNYISEKCGKETDLEAMHGIKASKKKIKDGDEEVKTYTMNDNFHLSYHSRLFSKDSGSIYWNPSRQSNLNTLFSFEQSVKRKLKTRRSHSISYNEMMDMIDLDPAPDGNVMGLKIDPKNCKLDENGLPDIQVVDYWLMNNGEYVKKSVNEELSQPTSFEANMLLDFPGLVYLN